MATSVVFYFQVHQPYRIRHYTFFNIGQNHQYFDDEKNRAILNKVADKCYLPANNLMLELISKYGGKFRITYSISGVALEQFEYWRPDVLESFKQLASTGCVEFLGETYYHSLSFVFNKEEFKKQVNQHKQAIKQYFKQTPKSFRNTELIYNNELAWYLEQMGYKAVLCEGTDFLLQGRNPNFIYRAPNVEKIKTLLKNYKLSDDIAFRFSDRNWCEWPLTAEKFASWVHATAGNGELINLFMDYETIGEHQWKESGIFDFIYHLPEYILKHPDFDFLTVSEAADRYEVRDVYDAHHFISWADSERDLSAWIGNPMQNEAISKIYELDKWVYKTKNNQLIDTWKKMLTSDHFYYMTTKFWQDGDVHKYFSPYDSPYDAYVYFMNSVADLKLEIENNLPSRKNR